MRPLRLGTRGSPLALWQAQTVARVMAKSGGPPCEIRVLKTSGDALADAHLSEIGGKRLFVKEIEESLLGGEIDLAVHSAKDMPVEGLDDLRIGAVLEREDPRDAIVLPAGSTVGISLEPDGPLASLASPPRVGTSSVRRVAQLAVLWPHAVFHPVRGNLDTRLRKLESGDYNLLVLAAAGLRRLGFADRIALALPTDRCLPAPGQGAIAVEVRRNDERTLDVVTRCGDPLTTAALLAERALVARLGGGCQIPIGALATVTADELDLQAAVTSLDGSRRIRGRGRGDAANAVGLGRRVADTLLAEGAQDILDEARRSPTGPGGQR